MKDRLIITVMFILSWVGPFSPVMALENDSNLLDGKTFVGLNGEKGRNLDPDEKEEMVFSNGEFISTTCNKYNFNAAPYTASREDDGIHFKAVTTSPTHGKIVWEGIVKGNEASATFVWTKERWYWDIHREYWFKGALQK